VRRTLVILLLFFAFALNAQTEERDALILYSSDVLVGRIVEHDENGKVIFMRSDSIMMAIDRSRVYKEMKVIGSYSLKKIKDHAFEPKKGIDFNFIVGPGVALSFHEGQFLPLIKFDFISAISIDESVSLGFGTGLRFAAASAKLMIPVFGDVRFTSKKRIGPILALGCGHAFSVERDASDYGLMGYVKLGVVKKYFNGGSVAFLFGADFGTQNLGAETSSFFGRSFEFSPREMVTSGILSVAFTF
jgi:hypothetical protein